MLQYNRCEAIPGYMSCTTIRSNFVHNLTAMSLMSFVVSCSLLWRCTTAFPAGPGAWPNGSSPSATDGLHASAFGLIDTYDASNWLSKFWVEDVSDVHGTLNTVANSSKDF
jgi:hypothetical protein